MKKYSKQLMLLLSLLIVVAYAVISCDDGQYKAKYTIDHYLDTVEENIILTTVCESNYNISSSTLILNKNDK